MFARVLTATLAVAFIAPAAYGEDAEAEIPGDGLDLYAVLDTFANSEGIEDFETRLNDSDAELVNLDLNGDDEVDYVTVVEEVDGSAHVVFLRVPVSENESQDVAYIALDKVGEDVTAQVIGDEALYGPDYVVEPETTETGGRLRPEPILLASAADTWPAANDANATAFDLAAVIVVSSWRVVRVVYAPGYHPWRSPWRWRHYPSHWRVRRPVTRSHYRSRHAHHARKGYRRTTVRRSHRASNLSRANHVASPSVAASTRNPASSSKPSSTGRTATTPAATPGAATGPSTAAKPKSATQPSRNTSPSNRAVSPGGPSRSNQQRRSSPGGPGGGPRRR